MPVPWLSVDKAFACIDVKIMQVSPHRHWVFRLATISLVGFFMLGTALVRAGEKSAQMEKLNGGYFLLHQLCVDEDKLPLLLVVKHVSPDIEDFADSVSRQAKDSLTVLDGFEDRDSSIRFDKNPLPQIEQDVRDSIKADKQHQLLFGTSNSEFERALLVSQIEATTYAAHLAGMLSEQERSPSRAKSLHHLSDQWLLVRKEAYRLLRDR